MIDNSNMSINAKLRFHCYSALMSQISRVLGWDYSDFQSAYDIFIDESLREQERKLTDLFVCEEPFEDELRVELVAAFEEIAQRDSELARERLG